MTSSLSGGAMLFSSPPRYRLKACKLIWSAGETERDGCVYFDHKKSNLMVITDVICYIPYNWPKEQKAPVFETGRCEHCGLDSGSAYRFWLNSVLAEQHIVTRAACSSVLYILSTGDHRKTCGRTFHSIWKQFPYSGCKFKFSVHGRRF